MTTVAAKRGGLKRWIAEWLYPEIKRKEEAVREAAIWNELKPCIKCKQELRTHEQFCAACGAWQEEVRQQEETLPVHFVKVGEEVLFFRQADTGELQLDGMRPVQAYRKRLKEQLEGQGWSL